MKNEQTFLEELISDLENAIGRGEDPSQEILATCNERYRNLPTVRLEQLRRVLKDECISYGELVELQSLVKYIEPGDSELLQAAGVPEFAPEFNIDIPDDAWKPVEGGSKRLYIHDAAVNGIAIHLHAFEIEMVGDVQECAGNEEDCTWFGDAAQAFYTDGPIRTIPINGKEYAIYAQPSHD